LILNQVWSLLVKALTRLTYGFNKCSEPQPLMSTQRHTSNRSLEVEMRKKRVPRLRLKRKKLTMAQLPPRLKQRPRHKLGRSKNSKRRPRERSELKKRRRDKDRLRRKSSNVL